MEEVFSLMFLLHISSSSLQEKMPEFISRILNIQTRELKQSMIRCSAYLAADCITHMKLNDCYDKRIGLRVLLLFLFFFCHMFVRF